MRLRVCATDELGPGEVRPVAVDPPVAVYNVGGEFYAIDDTCTHAEYTLSEGYVDDDQVECALHGARFCITDGKALCLPATVHLGTHPVVVEDGVIYVDLDLEEE